MSATGIVESAWGNGPDGNTGTAPQADSTTGDAGGDGAINAPMVAALEAAWAAIRARHPQVPAVVLLLGAGVDRRGGGVAAVGALRGDALARQSQPRQPGRSGRSARAGWGAVAGSLRRR
ncbi:MAG: hypothetical protein AB7V44_11675 [Pseudonocardia sp.]